MDEKPDQIIEHIEAQRSALGRNLNELETRVKRSTDWRTYYDRNPALAVGAALGGGLILGAVAGGAIMGGGGRSRTRRMGSRSSYLPASSSSSGTSGSYAQPGASGQPGAGSYGASAYSTGAAGSASTEPSRHEAPGLSSWAMGKSAASGPHVAQLTQALDTLKGALIAFGITKAKEFISQALPGIEPHLEEMGHKHHGEEHGRHDQSGSYTTGSAQSPASGGSMSASNISPGSGGTGSGGQDYRAGRQYTGSGSQTTSPTQQTSQNEPRR